MSNNSNLDQLIESSKNAPSIIEIDTIHSLLTSAETAVPTGKSFFKTHLIKIIMIHALIISLLATLYFTPDNPDEVSTLQTLSEVEILKSTNPDHSQVPTDNKVVKYHKPEANPQYAIETTTDSCETKNNIRVYPYIDPSNESSYPERYYDPSPQVTLAHKGALINYWPSLTEDEWAKIFITATKKSVQFDYYNKNRDTLQKHFFLSKSRSYFSSKGFYGNLDSIFYPLGMSNNSGDELITLSRNKDPKYLNNLLLRQKIIGFSIPQKDKILWYKITGSLLQKLPKEISAKIQTNHLKYPFLLQKEKLDRKSKREETNFDSLLTKNASDLDNNSSAKNLDPLETPMNSGLTQDKSNNPPSATSGKSIKYNYWPTLTEKEWATLYMTITPAFAIYNNTTIMAGDEGITRSIQIEKRPQFNILINKVIDHYDATLPVGISATSGKNFLHFTSGYPERTTNLNKVQKLIAFSLPFKNEVIWYKLTDDLIKLLPDHIRTELNNSNLKYTCHFESSYPSRLAERSKGIDSSLLSDNLAFKPKVAIHITDQQLVNLGFQIDTASISIKTKTPKGRYKLTLKNNGTNINHHIQKKHRYNREDKIKINLVFLSNLRTRSYNTTHLPHHYISSLFTVPELQLFLTLRSAYVPLVYKSPTFDSTLVLWYKPTDELFNTLEISNERKKEIKSLLNLKVLSRKKDYSKSESQDLLQIHPLELDLSQLNKIGIKTTDANISYKQSENEVKISHISSERLPHKNYKNYIPDSLLDLMMVTDLTAQEIKWKNNELSNYGSGDLSLVPIKVKSQSIFAPVECLMWFKPSPSFLQSLDNQLRNEIMQELELIQLPINGIKMAAPCKIYNKCKEQKISIQSMSVYPNPTSENVTVAIASNKACEATLTLSSIGGQELNVYDVKLIEGNNQEFLLDLSGHTEGVYILSIVSDQGDFLSQRIVKI